MISIKKLFCILSLFTNVMSSNASSLENYDGLEQNRPKVREHIVMIPGQDGWGGHNISLLFDDPEVIREVCTPSSFYADLGQDNCLAMLKQAMDDIVSKDIPGVILHASSQGTATALNYVAQYPNKVKSLILEAVLPSGNSTIVHAVKNTMIPKIEEIPGSYYWLPYLAKVNMPFYNPAGQQAILNVENIPDVPIVILHSRLDPQTPFAGAQALYAGLQKTGHTKTYLITIEKMMHLLTLDTNYQDEIQAIKSVLWNDNIFFDKNFDGLSRSDLTKYQPNLEECQKHYDDLVFKEKTMKKIDFCLKSSLLFVLGLGISVASTILFA